MNELTANSPMDLAIRAALGLMRVGHPDSSHACDQAIIYSLAEAAQVSDVPKGISYVNYARSVVKAEPEIAVLYAKQGAAYLIRGRN